MKVSKLLTGAVAFGVMTSAAVVGGSTAVSATMPGQPKNVTQSEDCYIVREHGWREGFNFNEDRSQVSYTVEVRGDNDCRQDFQLAAWKIMNDDGEPRPLANQNLYDYDVMENAAPGHHTLTVDVPQCYYQLDVVSGTNPHGAGPNGELPYAESRTMVGAYVGGDTVCAEEEPQEPQEPQTPEQPETPAEPEEPAGKGEEVPAELPETGAASVLGGMAGLGALTYGAANYMNSRRNLRDLFRK